ncbi:lysophospholipid acyltransferase family protein [Bdellovibrionota bacterium FG-2]
MGSNALGQVVLLFFRAIALGYYFSPYFLKALYGRGLGWLLKTAKLRLGVVEQNLQIAFPNEEKRARQSRITAAYVHLGNLVLEIFLVLLPFGLMRRFVRKWVTLEGLEHFRNAQAQGKGVILLTSHLGNWEVMAASAGEHAPGMNLMMVTKHLKPEWLHRAIEKGRTSCRVQATYEPRTLRDVLRHMKAGGAVTFVLDQFAGPPVGVRVPFFGVPVGTTTAVAALVRRTGAIVVPVYNVRCGKGLWRIKMDEALPWITAPMGDSHASQAQIALELALNTDQYTRVLEGHILSHSEQWLWIHRRFKGDLGPLRDGEWQAGRLR